MIMNINCVPFKIYLNSKKEYSLNNKTAVVTGGTSGIGLSIVKALIQEDYNVYFIGTNSKRGKSLESEFRMLNKKSRIEYIKLDLSDLLAVKDFIKYIKSENSKIDLLANIAGVLLPNREVVRNGIERSFAVSYLSAFYLSNQLSPLLEKGDNPQIVNVAADPSIINKAVLDFSDIHLSKKYSGFKASLLAVHAKTVLTKTLSKKLSNTNIKVNSFHPGNIKSGLFRNMPFVFRFLVKLFSPLFKDDSKTGIDLCLGNESNNSSGMLFVGKKPNELDFSRDYQDKLWNISEKMIEEQLR